MYIKLSYVIALTFLTNKVNSAKILGIYPTPSFSHQIVFRELTYELAKRGHELVVVTPNPEYRKDRSPDNITEIDASHMYMILEEAIKQTKPIRGVVLSSEIKMDPEIYKYILNFVEGVLKMQEFKAILDDKTQKFDLVIGEGLYLTPAAIAKKYDAPMIWFSSYYGNNVNYEMFGVPRHPLIHPSVFKERYWNLSLCEKIYATYAELRLWYSYNVVAQYEVELIKHHLDKDVCTKEELKNHIDLLFLNFNIIFEGNRPLPPNVIPLGALHMKPIEKLPQAKTSGIPQGYVLPVPLQLLHINDLLKEPNILVNADDNTIKEIYFCNAIAESNLIRLQRETKDLQSFLDSSKRGVIYVSLGTNVRPSNMDKDLLEVFLKSFAQLPYDILWKFDEDNIADIPKNVMVQKWFPQRDLLHHSKVKAFITQGGLQSTDEAIASGVPLVGIPALGDQWFNVEQYERLGIGVKLDFLTLQVNNLVSAVNTIIIDKSYRENIINLRNLMQDQKETPLERAVWWTEYVIRHKGAKHLRSTANVTWSEYLMLDVVGTCGFLVVVTVFVLFRILKFLLIIFLSRTKAKND